MSNLSSLKPSQTTQRKQLNSCLYRGMVFHRRRTPRIHQFRYQLFMVLIDLDEIDELFKVPVIWSTSPWSVACFRRSDYLGDPTQPLKQAVHNFVLERTGVQITGPVRLLTHLRYFGLSFNPVSFYYCYNQAEELQLIIAEVTNTPWGEKHHYIIPWSDHPNEEMSYSCPKEFHVSPFLPMNLTYKWKVSSPEDQLTVHLEDHNEHGCVFDAKLSLKKRPATKLNIVFMLIRFPFLSLRIVVAIYWQAFCLWWKNISFYPHPKTL